MLEINKSSFPKHITKGQGSCGTRSRLRSTPTNEVTLINLVKYLIRIVMVNYQLLTAQRSQKGSSQHSQAVTRFCLPVIYGVLSGMSTRTVLFRALPFSNTCY